MAKSSRILKYLGNFSPEQYMDWILSMPPNQQISYESPETMAEGERHIYVVQTVAGDMVEWFCLGQKLDPRELMRTQFTVH